MQKLLSSPSAGGGVGHRRGHTGTYPEDLSAYRDSLKTAGPGAGYWPSFESGGLVGL